MNSARYLGIWMDYSIAHLMELTNDTIVTNTIESRSKLQKEEQNLSKDESLMHNKEKNQRSAYFKRLSDIIKDYGEVVLFGPTDAKKELLNLLKDNHRFDKMKIEVKTTDIMTENQQLAFVKEYFITSG